MIFWKFGTACYLQQKNSTLQLVTLPERFFMNLTNLRLGVLGFMLLFLSVQIDCFAATTAQEEAHDCSICLEPLDNGQETQGFIHNPASNPCHFFHTGCINQWITNKQNLSLAVTCPNCRLKMWIPEEEMWIHQARRLQCLRNAFGILPPAEGCIEKLGRCLRRFFL